MVAACRAFAQGGAGVWRAGPGPTAGL